METLQDRPITGATIFGAEGALPEPEQPELPLVVWLRGDEDVCAEFVLDADEVMHLLGIKRSRLTQISGKDLRVGRIRRGRYVSPVYRPADVEAYANWTRATASHVKSSTLLNDAADELKRQGASLVEGVSENLRRHTAEILKTTTGELSDLRRALPDAGPQLERLEALMRKGFGEQAQILTRLGEALAQQAGAMHLMLQNLGEQAALWRSLRDEVRGQAEATRALGLPKVPTRTKKRPARPGRVSRESKPALPSTEADKSPTVQTSGSDASPPTRKPRRERHAAPPAPRRRRPSTARP